MRSPVISSLLLAALVSSLAACSLVLDTAGFSGGSSADPGDRDGGVAAQSDAGASSSSPPPPATSPPSGSGGGADAAPPPTDPCPSRGGPKPVHVALPGGPSCIDSTEVTNAQYAQFLASGVTPPARPSCAWNTSFVPDGTWPPAAGTEAYPVVGVDFCDADAFCAWAGKRLCKGAGRPWKSEQDGSVTEWGRACSRDGAVRYPYGDTFDAQACNGGGLVTKSIAKVASFPACIGGYPGTFDMSGNVAEWEDVCDGEDGAHDDCSARGGSFVMSLDGPGIGPSAAVACTGAQRVERGNTSASVGFRCCE